MNISITNIVALNGGDAAILLGTIKVLKEMYGKDVVINVFCTYPEICRKLYPEISWHETLGICADRTKYNHVKYLGRIARMVKRFKFYASACLLRIGINLAGVLLNKNDRDGIEIYNKSDIIISTGGTYLIEPYGITTQYIDYKICLLLNKRLVFYTQSMGPFISDRVKTNLGRIFNNPLVKLMLFRDRKSLNNAKTLLRKNVPIMRVVPDAAFSLGQIEILRQNERRFIGENKKIAFSVRSWDCFEGKDSREVMQSYIKSMADLAVELIRQGNTIYYFSTCQGIEEYDDDSKLADGIVKSIPIEHQSKVINTHSFLTIDEIRDLLAKMDFIVATRLHMSILALISGTPVFPIAYEFKTTELFKKLGYENVMEMQDVESQNLIAEVNHFMKHYDREKRISVTEEVSNYIAGSDKACEYLKIL